MRRNFIFGLFVGLITTLLALVVALELAALGVEAPYLALLLGIIGALVLDGPGAALAAVLLSTVAMWYFFVPPVWSFALPDADHRVTILLFFCVAAATGRLYHRQRRLIDRLNADNVTLKHQLTRIGPPNGQT